jgi:hypothetical protein
MVTEVAETDVIGPSIQLVELLDARILVPTTHPIVALV